MFHSGMMSLINTNYDYLVTMGISGDSPLVGVIVSVYYLGCAVGAVLASWFANAKGRKPGIFACLVTASLGNFIMFIAGLGEAKHAMAVMLLGRTVMGLGVGMCSTAIMHSMDSNYVFQVVSTQWSQSIHLNSRKTMLEELPLLRNFKPTFLVSTWLSLSTSCLPKSWASSVSGRGDCPSLSCKYIHS